MSLILDAGAFIAVEKGNRDVLALIKRERTRQRAPITQGGVVAQVWRGGRGRQVPLSLLLQGTEVRPLDGNLGKIAGSLLGKAGGSDVIDAALVCMAEDGDDILTADPDDLLNLARQAGVHVELITPT